MKEDLMSKIKAYWSKKWLAMPMPATDTMPQEETMDQHLEMMKSMPRYNPIEIIKYLLDDLEWSSTSTDMWMED